MADPRIKFDIVAGVEGAGEIDRLAASLAKLDESIDPAATARARELDAELQRLGEQQAAVARFQELSAATARARDDLTAADGAVAALRSEIEASGAPTTAQAGRLEKLGAAAQAARGDLQAQTVALDASRGRLAALGIDAEAASAAEAALGASTKAVRAELQGLAASLQGVRAGELVAELRQLGQQQQAIAQFRDLGGSVDKAKVALASAEQALEAYRGRIAGIEAPTAAQVNTQQRLGFAIDDAKNKLAAQTAALATAGAGLQRLGVDAGDLAAAEDRLRTSSQAVLVQVRELGQQQAAVQRFQELAASTERARTALAAADGAVDAFRAGMSSATAPTAAEAAELDRLAAAARTAQVAVQAQALAQADAGAALDRFGIKAKSAEDQARLLATNLQALQSGFRAAGGDADAMGQRLDAAFRTLGIRSVQQVTTEIDRLKAALVAVRAVDPFSADTQRATVAMQQKVQALEAELNQVPAAAQRAGAGITHVGQSSVGTAVSLEAATTKALALGSALLGIGSASQLAGSVLNTAAEFETLRLRLEQLLGSTAAATTAFDQIKQLAITTPFEVKDLTESFVRLANFGLKPTQTQMLALADTAAVAGGGTEALQRITLALGQAWAKTKLQGDEILQLTEAGVPVWDLLAKATGKNVVELQALSKEGALGRDVIVQLFDAIGERNAGASAKLMSTFSGAISNAKDAMAEFFDLIGKSGALDYLTKKITEALDEFQKLKDTGELERKAKAISDAFIKFAQGVELAFDAVRKLSTVLELLAAAWAAEKVIAFTTSMLGLQQAVKVATVATAELATVQTAAAASAAATSTAVAATGASATAAAAGVGVLGRAMGLLRGLGLGALVFGVAELAGKFFEAKKAAEDGDEAVRKMLAGPPEGAQKAKGAVRDVIAELDDFKKKLPNLQGDIAGLTGEGLSAVANSTIENLRAIKASGVDMGNAITVVAERAAQSLGIELPSQATKSSEAFKGVKAEADLLIGQLPNLGLSAQAASGVVSQALSRMVDAASTQRDFDQINASIKLMADAGRIGPGAVEELLTRVRDRAQEVKDKIESTTPGIQGLREAARNAGVDVGLLTTGVSEGFAKGVKQVTDLADQITKAGVSADVAGPQLKAAIDQRIAAATTKQELELVGKAVEGIGAKSPGMGAVVVEALDKIKVKSEDVKNAANSVGDAWKRLGVDITKSSEASSTQLIKDYEKAKASGTGSAEDVQAAFVKMAKAVIAANGGIVPEWLKVEAATRNAKIAVDEFGRATVSAMKDAEVAVNALGERLNQTAGSFSSMYSAALKARNAQDLSVLSKSTDSSGFSIDKSGNRIGTTVQANVPEGYAFDKKAFDREVAVSNIAGNGWYVDPQRFVKPVPVPVTKATPSSASTTAKPSSVSTSTASSAPTRNVEVTLNVAGQAVTGGFDSVSADKLLRALEAASRTAS